ncbi:hypothetical protein [Leptospira sp. GIMC2001]|uniref:hypothetical protein n=1 Tax=Leptospira sp. GIMC2001 TaxID=1513297 RepID=UPI002349A7CC|nr:hypothetical protein [Leptospira sp. GIMC2001]WCL49529.1 hypothetical protein O4O04_01560 [Leptospira sp. GIMC2001]
MCHNCQKIYKAIFYAMVLFTLLHSRLDANDIMFQPAKIEGDVRIRNQNVNSLELSKEFALLASDIVSNDFYINSTAYTEDQSDSNTCMNGRIHFVSRDIFYFPNQNIPSVTTTLRNCKTGKITRSESLLQGYIHSALKKHYSKVFRFLPVRNAQKIGLSRTQNPDISIFLDATGSMSYEKQAIQSFFKDSNRNTTSSSRLFAVSNGSLESSNGISLDDLAFGKPNSTDHLMIAFSRMIASKSGNSEMKINYLLLNPSHYMNSLAWISKINEARSKGFTNIILIPYQTSPSDQLNIEKIARATGSEFYNLIGSMKVGFADGKEKFLSISKGYLYISETSPLQKDDLDNSNVLIGKNRVSYEGQLNAFNIREAFEKATNNKIIKEWEFRSNLNSILNEVTEKKRYPDFSNGRKVLIRTHGEAFWININPSIKVKEKQTVIVESDYILDSYSANGIRNNPILTKVHGENYIYPKLLEFKPSEILDYINKYNLGSLRCYMYGVVEEIR